jgi:dihydroorotate dehydrogenase
MYKDILRPLLYSIDPEKVHYLTANGLAFSHQVPLVKDIIRRSFSIESTSLERNVFGLTFPNPVGLAAGFDKDARWIEALESLGFGFIEIGTITPKAQSGNDKPRLFRLQKDEALINRMGFNNAGVDRAVERIQKSKHRVPLGGNIGKNKVTPNENAVDDYLYSFKKLYNYVDYFVVNVSSPNTPGLRELQGKDKLKRIFQALFEHRTTNEKFKPVLLKIAPDLNQEQLLDIISLVKEISIDGLVVSNTTISRNGLVSNNRLFEENGGLSGKPVREMSTKAIKFIHEASGGTISMIGVGGIHSPEDAIEKLDAGAQLLQLYTGFVYEGPGLIKRINKRLIK